MSKMLGWLTWKNSGRRKKKKKKKKKTSQKDIHLTMFLFYSYFKAKQTNKQTKNPTKSGSSLGISGRMERALTERFY